MEAHQREPPKRALTDSWCKRFGRKAVEDHLGAALIQPGDSVIIIKERLFSSNHDGTGKQGGTASIFVPCITVLVVCGAFYMRTCIKGNMSQATVPGAENFKCGIFISF